MRFNSLNYTSRKLKNIYCTVLGFRVLKLAVSHYHFTIAMSVYITSDYILFCRFGNVKFIYVTICFCCCCGGAFRRALGSVKKKTMCFYIVATHKGSVFRL